ncbi:DCC1-like thiol-disulfide oxidoreductase family protein [Aequorivita ciconiae]|nr:DCC1-like thiol-disulfide oxidoreductase family protein [Aequorivita sp. H23M31]
MVWDGECTFCKYWITYWHSKTSNRIEYLTYQETANNFADIPIKEFKKASRFIDIDGIVYSGPDSAFKILTYFNPSFPFWHKWYTKNNLFSKVCDYSYNWIAKHRSFMFAITKLFFGKNPQALKPYWLAIFFLIVILTYLVVYFL